jgi:hypothetical protein
LSRVSCLVVVGCILGVPFLGSQKDRLPVLWVRLG